MFPAVVVNTSGARVSIPGLARKNVKRRIAELHLALEPCLNLRSRFRMLLQLPQWTRLGNVANQMWLFQALCVIRFISLFASEREMAAIDFNCGFAYLVGPHV